MTKPSNPLSKGLEKNPRDPVGWCGHGFTLCYLGRGTEALQSFAKAVTIDPNFYEVWFAIGTLPPKMDIIRRRYNRLIVRLAEVLIPLKYGTTTEEH